MTAKSGKRHGYSVDPALECIGNRTKMDCSECSILRPLHIRKRTDLNDRGLFLKLRVDICIFCKCSSDL